MPPEPHVLEPDTRALVSALAAVNGKIPEVGLALLEGRLGPERQRDFARLLVDLAELLQAHADRQFAGGRLVIPGEAAGVADAVSEAEADGRGHAP